MSDVILLDSGPVGLLTHPRNPPHAADCRVGLHDLLAAGRRVILPEVIDYEVRRELLRLGSFTALNHLDSLGVQLEYLPLASAVMRHAAGLWAHVRTAGLPTADIHALDIDVILAAQALSLQVPVVVATDNVAHLSRFVNAEPWQRIAP